MVVTAVLSFVLVVALHAAVCRLPLHIISVSAFICVAATIGIALAGLLGGSLLAGDSFAWAALLLYCVLCELYLFLFTLVATSVSATILRRLSAGPRQPRELESVYAAERMVEQRFRRLLAGGFIRGAEDQYELTQRGQTSLRIFGVLRAFFRHAPAPIS